MQRQYLTLALTVPVSGWLMCASAGCGKKAEAPAAITYNSDGAQERNGKTIAEWIQALAIGDPADRARAATVLGRIGAPAQSAAPALREMLAVQDDGVRLEAALTLMKLGERSDPVARALVSCVNSTRLDLRDSAVEGLAELGTNGIVAVPELVKIIGEPGNPSADKASDALMHMGAPAFTVLVDALQKSSPDRSAAAAKILAKAGSGVFPAVAPMLKSRDLEIRQKAARLMLDHPAEAGPFIVGTLSDASPEIRRFGADLLATLGTNAVTVVKPLVAALKDTDTQTRMSVQKAVIQLGAPAVPALIELLKDNDAYTRLLAMRTLAALLHDGDTETVMGALRALQAIGPDAAGALKDVQAIAEKHPGAKVRSVADDALRAIRP